MYPKMLYHGKPVAHQKALEHALHSGAVRHRVVRSKEERVAAEKEGWTEDLAGIVGEGKKPDPKAKEKP